MNIFSERLRFAMNAKKMKQSQLALYTGIDKSVISCYLSGRYEPKQENLFSLSKILGVSAAWLAGHDVPMVEEKEKSAPRGELSEEIVIYHRDGKSIVKKFSPEQIGAIHAFLEAMPGDVTTDDGES